MIKKILKLLLIILLALSVLLFIFKINKSFQDSNNISIRRGNIEVSSLSHSYKNSKISTEISKAQINLQKHYMMSRIENYNHIETEAEEPPFKCIGGAGTMKIIDAKGNTILVSDSETGLNIFGAKASPNNELICVEGGNGKSWIFNPVFKTLISIPKNPPIENSFAFSNWEWINNDLLIAQSGIQMLDRDGNPITSCGGNTTAETKLYAYQVSTKELVEVKLPKDFPVKVFNISRVSKEGYIEIMYDEHDQHPPETHEHNHAHSFQSNNNGLRNLGWFKVEE